MKAYSTRVGRRAVPDRAEGRDRRGDRDAGPRVRHDHRAAAPVGWFDAVPLRYAVAVNSVSSIMLNKLDILSGLDEILLCVAYEIDGAPGRALAGLGRGAGAGEADLRALPGLAGGDPRARGRPTTCPPNARALRRRPRGAGRGADRARLGGPRADPDGRARRSSAGRAPRRGARAAAGGRRTLADARRMTAASRSRAGSSLVGGGGREHALAWRLAGEPASTAIVAPGERRASRPTCRIACAPDRGRDGPRPPSPRPPGATTRTSSSSGPEAPLAAGVADALAGAGIPVFGPSAAAARIESSKAFCHEIAEAAGVPMARGRGLRRARAGARVRRRAGAPRARRRGQGRRAGGRQGRHGLRRRWPRPRRRSRARSSRTARSRPARRGSSSRSALRGPGGERDRDLRRRPRRSPSRRPATTSGWATATGPEHGRHGRLLAAAGSRRRAAADVVAASIARSLAELARRGMPFRGALYAGLMLTPDGPRPAGVQRPLRRPGDAGDPAAARRPAGAAAPRGRARAGSHAGGWRAGLRAVTSCRPRPRRPSASSSPPRGYPGRPVGGDAIEGLDAAARDGRPRLPRRHARAADGALGDRGRTRARRRRPRGRMCAAARTRPSARPTSITLRRAQRRRDIARRPRPRRPRPARGAAP